jgi:hypothetical protein
MVLDAQDLARSCKREPLDQFRLRLQFGPIWRGFEAPSSRPSRGSGGEKWHPGPFPRPSPEPERFAPCYRCDWGLERAWTSHHSSHDRGPGSGSPRAKPDWKPPPGLFFGRIAAKVGPATDPRLDSPLGPLPELKTQPQKAVSTRDPTVRPGCPPCPKCGIWGGIQAEPANCPGFESKR